MYYIVKYINSFIVIVKKWNYNIINRAKKYKYYFNLKIYNKILL